AGMSPSRTHLFALFAFSSILFGACSVGPDFQRPAMSDPAGFAETGLPLRIPAATAELGGEAQNLRAGNDLARDWWTLFHSAALNQFIAAALRDNPSVAAAS